MIPHFHLCIGLNIVEPLLGYQIRTSIFYLKKCCFTHHSEDVSVRFVAQIDRYEQTIFRTEDGWDQYFIHVT